MTVTLQTILFVAGGLWGLASLAFVVALALAAAKHTPDLHSSPQGKGQVRSSGFREHRESKQIQTV